MIRAAQETFSEIFMQMQALGTSILLVIYYVQPLGLLLNLLIPTIIAVSSIQILHTIFQQYSRSQVPQKGRLQQNFTKTYKPKEPLKLFQQGQLKDLKYDSLQDRIPVPDYKKTNTLSYRSEELKDQSYYQGSYQECALEEEEMPITRRGDKNRLLNLVNQQMTKESRTPRGQDSRATPMYSSTRKSSHNLTPTYTGNPRENYQTKSGNEEFKRLKELALKSSQEFHKAFDYKSETLRDRTRDWFMTQMLPMFLETFKINLVSLNGILKEQFDRRVRESDCFFPDATNVGSQPVSIDQLLQFYTTMDKHGSLSWVPNNIEKFNREHRENFVKLLSELSLFDKILNMKFKDRFLRGRIIDRLLDINETHNIFTENTNTSDPSDIEILSQLFINIVNKSIDYERTILQQELKDLMRQSPYNYNPNQRFDDSKKQIQNFQELFLQISIWTSTTEQFNIEVPKENTERVARATYFVQQVFVKKNENEPIYNVYSDALYLKAKPQMKYFCNEIVNIYKTYYQTENSIFGAIGLYFVHILCLPKQVQRSIQDYKQNQQFLYLVMDAAQDFQYSVKI